MPILPEENRIEGRRRDVAIGLALTLGIGGAHKFYLGEYKMGMFMLAFCWTFIPMLAGWRDAIRYILVEDWEEYLNEEETQWQKIQRKHKEKRKEKKKKKERKKKRRENWRENQDYVLVDKYKKRDTGTLRIEEWTEGDSEVQASIDSTATTKGKTGGAALGPLFFAKSKSKSKMKGDISGSIEDNTFSTKIKSMFIKDNEITVKSDDINFDIFIPEISNVYDTGSGLVVEVSGTTFRFEDISGGGVARRYIKKKLKEERRSPTESQEQESEVRDKIEELQQMYRDGLISQTEFEAKRQDLLDEM